MAVTATTPSLCEIFGSLPPHTQGSHGHRHFRGNVGPAIENGTAVGFNWRGVQGRLQQLGALMDDVSLALCQVGSSGHRLQAVNE